MPDKEGHASRQQRGGELAQASGQHGAAGELRHRGAADDSGHPRKPERRTEYRVADEIGAEREQRGRREESGSPAGALASGCPAAISHPGA